MAILERLYSFLTDYTNKTPIDDRKIDAEFNQIIAALNYAGSFTSTTLTAAQIAALDTTAIEVVAATAGTLIIIDKMIVINNYAGGAFTDPNAGLSLQLKYDDGSGSIIGQWDSNTLLESTVDIIAQFDNILGTGQDSFLAADIGKNVSIDNANTQYTIGSNSSVFTVIMLYHSITTGL